MTYQDGKDELSDILRSLLIEANPTIPDYKVTHLINKYQDMIWARTREVFVGH